MITTEFLNLVHDNNIFELRALHPDGSITSGVFDDTSIAQKYAKHEKLSDASLFYSLNPLSPTAKFAQEQKRNFMCSNAVSTARDKDISHRSTYLIDVDPVRPSGVCSTDAELKLAHDTADQIKAYLTDLKWPQPIVVCSGNGVHLLYKGDGCSAEGRIWRYALKFLASRFNTPKVKVDTAVYNAARISRLPGTMNMKGENTPERPWRRAEVISAPEHWTAVPAGLVFNLGKMGGFKSVWDNEEENLMGLPNVFSEPDVIRLIETFSPHLSVFKRTKFRDEIFFGLAFCPIKGCEHTGQRNGLGKSCLILVNGKLGFRCFSDDCSDISIGALIRHLEQVSGKKSPLQLYRQPELDFDQFDGDLEFCEAIPFGVWDNASPEGIDPVEVLAMYKEAVMLELRYIPNEIVGKRMIRAARQVLDARDVEKAASYLGSERIDSLRNYLRPKFVPRAEILRAIGARRVEQQPAA